MREGVACGISVCLPIARTRAATCWERRSTRTVVLTGRWSERGIRLKGLWGIGKSIRFEPGFGEYVAIKAEVMAACVVVC